MYRLHRVFATFVLLGLATLPVSSMGQDFPWPIEEISPAQNALNVPPTRNISVRFETKMDGSTINKDNFVVSSQWDGAKDGAYTLLPGGTIAKFDPVDDFKPGEVVSVVLTTGIESSSHQPLERSFAWTFTVVVGAGWGTFWEDTTTYPLPSDAATRLCAADFDLDGDNDLAVVSRYTGDPVGYDCVGILENDGYGKFTVPYDYSEWYFCGRVPDGVSAADFNNNGKPDIVTCNSHFKTISILMNNHPGVVAFSGPAVYPTDGVTGRGLTVGDFNGDGFAEVAVGGDDKIAVFLNQGYPTFSFSLHQKISVGFWVENLVAADFDLDGSIDLATGTSGDQLKILLNKGDGTGSFHEPLSFSTLPAYCGRGIEAGDLDGDGDNDLLATSGSVSIMMNRIESDPLLEHPERLFERGYYALHCGGADYPKVGDIDFDCDLDFFIKGRSCVFWPAFNYGDATFQKCGEYCTGERRGIAVADLNGDEALDVAVLHYPPVEVRVLFNVPPHPCSLLFNSPVCGNGILEPGEECESASDCGLEGLYSCEDCMCVPHAIPNIVIPNTDSCVNPGEYVCLPILLSNSITPFGGFELEVEYDYTSMTFVDAEPGELIEGFEKFTYRLLPCPACGCCKYKILLFGMYDIPNGVENIGDPIPMTPPGEYGELVNLCFVVNNDENLRGLKIPVCWEWEGTVVNDTLVEDWECEENTFSSWSGDTLFTSSLLCQFNPDICDDPGDRIQPILVFQQGVCGQNCGGVDVCPAGPGECKRGDINYNTITYEVADAVLFASYFVEGMGVFRYDVPYQICATDVNADGRTLTLSDLVYLIRVILHDAVELPKLTPSSEVANVIVEGGTISAECAAPIGAILFEFDSVVNPTLLADMEMLNKGNKVLVWSRNGKSFSSGEVLTFAGEAELIAATAVDRDSRELTTTISGKVSPPAFALHPAYPNPFNPFTNLSFDLPEAMNYSLKIYNVTGQLVRSYENMGSVGLNTITWDSKDNAGVEVASGVYFYKLTAGDFSATEKMVILK